MKSKKYICIELYDHASDEEIADILQDLDRLGFSHKPFFALLQDGRLRECELPRY